MKLYTFLAEGFETVEALCVVDILRRGGVEVTTVSISDDIQVESKQEVKVVADKIFAECDFSDGDALFLPGGIPGTPNLKAQEGLKALLHKYNDEGKYIAAICAAPTVLGVNGMLEGKKATCYPGCEDELYGAEYTASDVEVDGNIITSKGMGTTIELGLKLLEILVDKTMSEEIGKAIMFLK